MNKEELLKSISDVIEHYGPFNLLKNGFSTPVLQKVSIHEIYIDKINLDEVDCTEYINGNLVDEFSLGLEDFTEDILGELLTICQSFAYKQEIFFNSCFDENF